MPSRLDDLRRHRAQLQEHINLLDQEIAEEVARNQGVVPSAPPAPFSPIPPRPSPAADAEADRLFAQFRAEAEQSSGPPSRSGCWVIFWGILLVLIGLIGVLVYFLYR